MHCTMPGMVKKVGGLLMNEWCGRSGNKRSLVNCFAFVNTEEQNELQINVPPLFSVVDGCICCI